MAQSISKMETIQAVDRAFLIIETVSRANSVSLQDLQKKLGINKASLSRLVFTLVENGYLTKSEKTGDYSLTLKSYEIGLNAVQNLDKISLINSTLADLNANCGRIAQFSIEDGNQLLCLQSIGKKQTSFSVYTNVGQRSPLYCTSAGKALLSTYSNSDIIDKWNELHVKALTEHTCTDVHSFLQDISLIRQRGYALDKEENEYNVFCIGVPVLDHTNKPLGAISISGDTMTQEDETKLSTLLVSSAKRLSNLLGYVAN